MTYEEALTFIHGVNWQWCKPGLERIRALLHALGDPQDKLQFVHIAGTNGKGSTCAMTESILRAAGYKTGLYTSPYIWRFNERMAVMGQPIDDDTLAALCTEVKPIADAMVDKPTEFELITAIGMLYFYREQCDVVVLEVGLGGRLDATNVIKDPIACAVTGISLDHTAILGNTLGAIAGEKAGILKPGVPAVFGGDKTQDEAYDVISARANELGCTLARVNHDELTVHKAVLGECVFSYKDWKNVTIHLSGTYQPHNAATVLELVGAMRARGLKITDEDVYRGMANAEWRGRFEVLSKDPTLIFDGSHNPEGIAAAVEAIRHYYPNQKILLVTGVMRDKDYHAMAASLAPLCAAVFTLAPDNPSRALPADILAETYRKEGVEAAGFATADEAVAAAMARARKDNLPVFALGSLYMYGQIKTAHSRLAQMDC